MRSFLGDFLSRALRTTQRRLAGAFHQGHHKEAWGSHQTSNLNMTDVISGGLEVQRNGQSSQLNVEQP